MMSDNKLTASNFKYVQKSLTEEEKEQIQSPEYSTIIVNGNLVINDNLEEEKKEKEEKIKEIEKCKDIDELKEFIKNKIIN